MHGLHRLTARIERITRSAWLTHLLHVYYSPQMHCIWPGVYAGHEDYSTYGGMRRKELQALARMMQRDGLNMRRRKEGKEQCYQQAIDWLADHPEAV